MIAVIIPFYEDEQKLREALYSLEGQTYKRFITVISDDASPTQIDVDKLKEDFASLNIVYLRASVNRGVGPARQLGLNWAIEHNMESVTFLDSDDMFMPHTLDRLTYELNHTRAQVIYSSIVRERQHSTPIIIDSHDSLTWTHGKIYRVSYLVKHDISFDDSLRTNEDICFNLKVYFANTSGKEIGYINDQLYCWRDNKKSLTNTTVTHNQCLGADYIRAIYVSLMYSINSNCLSDDCISNIFNSYNYYEIMQERDHIIPEDIDDILREMLNMPFVTEIYNNGIRMQKYAEGVRPFYVDKDKIYYFQESFATWLNKFRRKE